MTATASPAPRSSSERWGAVVGLGLVLGGVVWARTRGLDYLLPHLPEPQGHVVAWPAVGEAAGALADPGDHAGLLDRMLAIGSGSAPPPAPPPEPSAGADLEAAHLARAAGPWIHSRRVVAAGSALAVPATFAIALGFVRPWTALLAALLAGASFLSLQFSGQARPHGLAAALVPLAVAAACWLRRRPTPLAYLLAGAAAGLALGALQAGAAVLPSLLAADLLRDRARERGGAWKRLLPVVAIGAACAVFYPTGAGASARALAPGEWTGTGFGRLLDVLRWNDPLLLWGGLAGIALALVLRVARRERARSADLWVVLAHALPYLALLALWGGTADRFVLPLVPYLALSTAFALGWVVERFTARITPSPWQRALFGLPLCAAALAWPVTYDARFLSARAAPDSLELAAAWLRRSAGPADRIRTSPRLVLPILAGGPLDLPDSAEREWWLAYQRRHRQAWADVPWPSVADPFLGEADREAARAALRTPEGAQELVRGLRADWFVLEVSPRARASLGEPGYENLRQALFALGRRVERVRPRESGPDSFYYYQDAEELGDLTLRTTNLGPELEIWRLERP